tara:strand:+ start:181 stop:411 length:231 start_codon:yes stop_codon:yes gene_type:complete
MSEVERNITQTVSPVENTAPSTPGTVSLPPPGQPLGQNLALKLLVNAVHMAQSRGAYSLDEASICQRAIKEFTVPN